MVKLRDIAILGALAAGALFLIEKAKGKNGEPPPEPKDILIEVNVFPKAGESPLSVGFDVRIINQVRPLRKIVWDFGDGDSSQFLNPSHIYTTDLQVETFFPVISVEDAEGNTATGQGQVAVFGVTPPDELVSFQFLGVIYMIPRAVWNKIQQIIIDFPNPFVAIEMIRALLIPFGAPPK